MTDHFALSRRSFLMGSVAAAGLIAAPSVLRAQSGEINVYSARHYDSDKRLISEFTEATGIRVNVIEAGADALIERIRSEGASSPVDVLLTVDAGRLVAAQDAGMFQPVSSSTLDERIPDYLRDPEGHWFGFSKRARVLMLAKDRASPGDISSYEELVDEKWRGRVLTRSSTNIYSQSLVGSMIAAHGAERTEEWARGLVANLARDPRGGDTDQILACAAGEGDLCIANTYYLGRLIRSEKPEERAIAEQITVVFPNQADRGTHVNISGAGVARNAPNAAGAQAFLEYLASDSAQYYFAEGNSEYPVVAGVPTPEWILAFGEFKEDALNASVFARNNAEALMITDRAGWK